MNPYKASTTSTIFTVVACDKSNNRFIKNHFKMNDLVPTMISEAEGCGIDKVYK